MNYSNLKPTTLAEIFVTYYHILQDGEDYEAEKEIREEADKAIRAGVDNCGEEFFEYINHAAYERGVEIECAVWVRDMHTGIIRLR